MDSSSLSSHYYKLAAKWDNFLYTLKCISELIHFFFNQEGKDFMVDFLQLTHKANKLLSLLYIFFQNSGDFEKK